MPDRPRPRARPRLAALARRAAPTVLAAALVGCGGGSDTPPPPSKAAKGLAVLTKGSAGARAAASGEEKPPPPPPAPTGVVVEDEVGYVYSPIGKRDPFRSLFDSLQLSRDVEQLTELQRFELDQLKLVGIVSRIATPYAMVEDPSGKGHTITRGKLIGKNWGRVSQITPECVVVKEEYRDYTGRKVTNKTEMCIPTAAELDVE